MKLYLLKSELIHGLPSTIGIIDKRFSGEKPFWDENSSYFAPAATWDRTLDLWDSEYCSANASTVRQERNFI